MKKQITRILLLSLLLSLASCGSGENPADTTASSIDSTTAAPVIDEYADELPDTLDFGGETLKIFCTDYEDYDSFNFMMREEADGDVTNDAIYNRNQAVSERLGLSLDWIRHAFDYGSRNEMYTAVRTSVMSGDGSYELLCIPTYFNSTLIAEGLISDMKELQHIDFDKPYWFQSFTEQATIDGKQYMAAGEGLLPYITGLYCLAFNKSMVEDNKLENFYELVYSGSWTIDKMNSITKSMYSDLNGNTTPDVSDRYGLELLSGNFGMGFMGGCAMDPIKQTKNGFEFTFDSERCSTIYDKIFVLLHESADSCFIDDSYREKRGEAPFVQGRALFTGLMLKDTKHFRDLKFDYGILPYPKFDADQENYSTRSASGTPVFLVPVTSAGSEKVGAFLEALASESHDTTTPAYFETTLKVKYSSGDDMSNMFDIVRNSEYMSYGSMFAAEIGAPEDTFRNNVMQSTNSGIWSSTAASIKAATMEKLDAYLGKLAELE